LLASGLEPEGFALPLRKLRVDAELFRPENVPLLNEEKKLAEEYLSINGAQTVQWEGKEIPIFSLYLQMQDPDRERREQVWRTFNERKLEDREALGEVWIQGLQVRQQLARNAGYDNYREYRWQQLYRFDYTPDDCKALHEAVEQVIVPVASQIAEKRRKLLGVERLRPWDTVVGPWDLAVDPRSSEAPRAIEDIDALLRKSADLFDQAEVASTSMEFIGSMNLHTSGLCSKEEAQHMRLQHLEGTLLSLPRIIRGDAFQHWVYENPEQALDPEAVGRKWAELGRRFEPDPDWSELEVANSNGWQYIQHFFEVPFYYIEYAFALIGALQVWRNYLRDPQDTIQQYRHALSLGTTRSLPELYTAADAKFAFDVTLLQDIVQLVTGKIEELEQEV
jgi:oligoendopeptidase F